MEERINRRSDVVSCTYNRQVDCEEYRLEKCKKCGFYPGVGDKRLKKRFTTEQIVKLRSIPIVKVG